MSFSNEQITDPKVGYRFDISDQQRTIIRYLAEKSQELADIYVGALRVLADNSNPERFNQSAHSIREFMEKLPFYWPDFPTANKPKDVKQLRDKLKPLCDRWKNLAEKTHWSDGNWNHEIDDPLRGFLKTMQEFVENYEQEFPVFKEQSRKLFRLLSPYAASLPEQEAKRRENARVQRWVNTRTFFVEYAHHRPNNIPYLRKLEAFESMLLSEIFPRVRPAAIEDLNALDRIIRGDQK